LTGIVESKPVRRPCYEMDLSVKICDFFNTLKNKIIRIIYKKYLHI